jgi:hypothetical protein
MKSNRLFHLLPPAQRGGAPSIRVPKRRQSGAVTMRVNSKRRRIHLEGLSPESLQRAVPTMRVIC